MKAYRNQLMRLSIIVGVGLLTGVLQLLMVPIVGTVLLLLCCLVGILPLARDIRETMRQKRFGVDLIALVAVLSALLLQEYWAAYVILVMLTGGEALELYAQSRAQQQLKALLNHAPRVVHIKSGKEYEDRRAEVVTIGDVLLVKPGEVVPVDGVVLKGSSEIDESTITGESQPVEVTHGSKVLSGAVNGSVALEIRAEQTVERSQYAQIIKLVRDATESRAPLVRLADTFSLPFTIVAFSLAGLGWWLSGDPVRALEVLVVATPCPLLIATPVAIVAGMNRAAAQGIIMKNGTALEQLARARTIAFDKTGTLTHGKPQLGKVVASGVPMQKLIQYAASLEAESAHVFARAVVALAIRRKATLKPVNHVTEVVGRGVKGLVGSSKVLVGNYRFLDESRVRGLERIESVRKSDLLIAIDGIFAGYMSFVDEVREESKPTIEALRSLGLPRVMMLTGDKPEVANLVANAVQIYEVYAQCLPQDKLAILEAMPKIDRPLAMVGDGVNDAPILAASDVGIALGAKGSTAASESAQIVILEDSLARVADAVEISKRALRVAYQSITIGIGLSVVLMVYAASFGIPPITGALMQEALDVVVILNALRARV